MFDPILEHMAHGTDRERPEEPEPDYEAGQIENELLEIERAKATCDPNYDR